MAASAVDTERQMWRATGWEEFFALSHDNFCNLTSYCILVGAQEPLQYNQVYTAMQHLYRKLPNLRSCTPRDADGVLWMCSMPEEKLNLQFLDGSQDIEDVFIGETRKQYDVVNGPLWRVTVMPADTPHKKSMGDCDHFHYVVFGLHHAITDGHSSVRMCGYFVKFLNDVIDGNIIDDGPQLAEFKNFDLNAKVLSDAKVAVKSDQTLREKYMKIIDEQNKLEMLFFKIFPSENDPHPKTYSISNDIDEKITKQFIAKAKSERVTIHSAFCTALHAVFVELLNESEAKQKVYLLPAVHDVNTRRYWEVNGENIFGVHIGAHFGVIKGSDDFIDNFWQNARLFHAQFNAELADKHSYMVEALESELKPPVSTADAFYNDKTPSKSLYAISNIGDISKFFKKSDGSDYNSVRALHLRRSTSVHSYATASTYCIQTMNGQLLCSFDYNTRYISRQTARLILDKTIQVLEKIVQE